ncbi:MAG: AAA family ATPase [Prevotella sp.]|nr:AAA family ATPase [Prevotella sp.]
MDAVSCFHRFRDIYTRRGLKPEHLNNIDVWNLRGHAVSMDRLAPVLIHRFKGKNYIAVIIDPIYKVLGNLDENAAGDMARFCNEFDRIATEMDVATIYCHHHSKGASGKYANAADRSSGSGVFARDPDAILDLTELDVSEVEDKYRAQVPDACEAVTGWELSGTLREFPPLPVKRLWFDYPYHRPDEWNFLADVNVQGQKKKKDKVSLEEAFALSELGRGAVRFEDLMAAIGLKEKTLSNLLPKSEFESAPIIAPDGKREKLVIRRSTNEFTWNGTKYDRDHMQPVPRLWKPVE